MAVAEALDALFVMPPGGARPRFSEPIGAAFLRAILADSGITSAQYAPRRNGPLAAFARALAARRPRLIGLTVYESNLRICRAMVRVARETLPDTVLIAGGPNATFSPEETLDLLGVDACLRGAGEGSIAAIAEALLGAARPARRLPELLAAVPNLVIRTEDGVRRTRAGHLSSFPSGRFRSLDDLPSPYQRGLVASAEIGYLTARGCNLPCTYCSFASLSGRKVHYHSVERVLDDLAVLERMARRAKGGPSAVTLFDDAFSLAPQRARAICEGILRRGLRMRLACETRADRVDAELLRLMRRAGFETVSFGLESAEPRVLRAIGKVQDPGAPGDPRFEKERSWLESFRRAVVDAQGAGLSPVVSVIGGLPGETPEDFGRTLAFVRSLEVGMYIHNVLSVFPGTPLYADRERHGLGVERDASSWAWRTRHAYAVDSVAPLRSSHVHLERWEEARLLADALCGRPPPAPSAGGGAWAVVLHGGEPGGALARWLRDVLEVHGTVVLLCGARARSDSKLEAWQRAMNSAAVPYGVFALLSREGRAAHGAEIYRSRGTRGEHRFEVHSRWPAGLRGIALDRGGCGRVPVWIASRARRGPPALPRVARLLSSTLQVADGCRWWSGWRRCRRPRVLHVWPDGVVTPCWGGEAIGSVGDAYRDLARRGEALCGPAQSRGSDACPLGAPGGPDASTASASEWCEAAGQAAWLLARETHVRKGR